MFLVDLGTARVDDTKHEFGKGLKQNPPYLAFWYNRFLSCQALGLFYVFR